MKEIKVSVNTWYVVEGTAGATVINPSTNKAIATVEDGKQTAFYATTPYVLVSDDSVNVFKATFNSAPAKLRLLGLLGGGSSSSALPSGYIAAEFLESTGEQYATIPFAFKASENTVLIETLHYYTTGAQYRGEGYRNRAVQGVYNNKAFFVQADSYGRAVGSVKLDDWNLHKTQFSGYTFTFFFKDGSTYSAELDGQAYASNYKLFRCDNNTTWLWLGRKKYWKATVDGKVTFNLVPSIDTQGVPCFYDKVSGSTYSSNGTEQFIVGMTCKQALKLAELPATGGTLTVSLPTGYESDAGVQAALEAAAAKGWDITERTHEAGASAVATFGMRRIWVRRTQNDYGMYVDADGTRWHIDWCVGMHNHDGSEPDAHGYELFRSVDSAVSYWELEPYVDPEQEELLTAYNKNEQ